MKKTAVISKCGKYRYVLTREWGFGETCVFIGLNPSTADDKMDDPTIRRCINFAKSWYYGKLVMVNAYAFRATNPKDMKNSLDPIGELNNEFLTHWNKNGSICIAAWGTNIDISRQNTLKEIFKDNLHYLKLTKDGFPSHPLYLPKITQPIKWK